MDQLTLIPNQHGRDPDDPAFGLVSLVFFPRLGGDPANLNGYADWRDWPSELQSLQFTVYVAGDGTNPGVRLTPAYYSVDVLFARTPAWRSVFTDPRAIPVTPWAFRQAVDEDERLRTAPEADLAVGLADLRRQLIVDFLDGPPTIEEILGGPNAPDLPLDGLDGYFVEPSTPPGGRAQVRQSIPDNEFHAVVQKLRNHPHICRLLGLTVEMRINIDAVVRDIPQVVSAAFPLQVLTNWQRRAGGREAAYARVGSDESFYPFTDNPLIKAHQLNLDRTDVFKLQFGKALSAGAFLQAALADADSTDPFPPPPDRASTQISLYAQNRASTIEDQLARAREIEQAIQDAMTTVDPSEEPPPAFELFLDDVAVVYRVDVSGGAFGLEALRSLHERTAPRGYYVGGGQTITPPDDESWIGTWVATDDGGMAPKVPERVATWSGWSFAAPRLETRFVPATGQPLPPPDNRPDPASPVQFGVDYEVVDKSLPRLEYGELFTMRVRLVDMAGNSAPGIPAVTHPEPLFFGRGAPVLAPSVVRRFPKPADALPGESVVTVVMRSLHDQPDDQVPAQERLVFPPGGLPLDYELMQFPDDLHTAEAYRRFVALDNRTLDDLLAEDPTTGEPIVRGDGAGGPAPVGQVADYLPDPAARGLRFPSLPTQKDAPLLVDYLPGPGAGVELRKRAQRLIVRAGDQPPEQGGDDQALVISVPKACIWEVDVSHSLTQPLAAKFVASFELGGPEGIIDGQHWLVSHRTTLTFVHAIEIGRFAPGFLGDFAATRPGGVGDTTATFSATVRVDVPATSAFVYIGRWSEPIDDPSQPTPRPGERREGVLDTVALPYDHEADEAAPEGSYDFGDTKRRVVRVIGEALSRFTAYFADQPDLPDRRSTREGPSASLRIVIPNSAQPSGLVDVRVEAATSRRFRRRDGQRELLVNQQVVRVSMARPWFDTGGNEMVGVVLGGGEGFSVAGRDPIRVDGDAARQLGLEDFPAAVASASGIGAQLPGTAGLTAVDVAGFLPTYDPVAQRWVADIEIETPGYRPFVRLAVARFQPDSIDVDVATDVVDPHLSPITFLDQQRLGVQRQVTVSRGAAPETIAVTMVGDEHDGRPDPDGAPAFNSATAVVQEADSAIADDTLRWVSVGDPVELARGTGPDGVTYTGELPFPTATTQRRLLVEEFEPVVREGSSVDGVSGTEQVLAQTVPLPGGRIAGPGREETAVLIGRQQYAFGGSAEAVVIARRDNFADGLAGTPFAASVGGPLLLTGTADLHPATLTELQRILAEGRTVYLLGGTAALSEATATAIEDLGYVVDRVQGPTRFETAVAIAERMPTVGSVFLTRAGDFPDALSAGPAAIDTGGIILLSGDAVTDAATDAFLATIPPEVPRFAIGGQAAAAYPDAEPIVGVGREQTAVLVAQRFFPGADVVGIARSNDFADALAGGVLMGLAGGPMLLTAPAALHPEPDAYLRANAATIGTAYLFGGPAALSQAVAQAVDEAIR